MRVCLVLSLVGLAISFAVPASMAQDAMKVVTADEVVFKDDPVIPKGGQNTILIGDPSKAETIVCAPNFHPITKFRRTLILFRKSSLCLAALVGTGWVMIWRKA